MVGVENVGVSFFSASISQIMHSEFITIVAAGSRDVFDLLEEVPPFFFLLSAILGIEVAVSVTVSAGMVLFC